MMKHDMRRGADAAVRPMRPNCDPVLSRRKERRSGLLRRLLHPFIGQVTSPCRHRTDGTMCDECAWRWAIR